MRPLLLAGTSLLALSASITTASALPLVSDTPGFQTFTVPSTGLWGITALGAQGGGSANTISGRAGGLGAEAVGDFQFTAGSAASNCARTARVVAQAVAASAREFRQQIDSG